MPVASLGDVDLYYEVQGSGPRLVFISGTGGDLRNRPGVFDGPLKDHFEVLAYDQRGLGQSAVPPGPYTMAHYGDDCADLMDHLGWERAAVMGVSFGGMVAQELALRHPDRVERLVLACTSAGGAGGASYPLHELAGLSPAERAERSISLSDTRMDEAWRTANPDRWKALIEGMTRPPANVGAMPAAGSTVGAGSVAEAGAEGEPSASMTGATERLVGPWLQLEARRGHDTWERLGAIGCPTFVCGGEFDGIAPKANVENLAGAIPGAELAFYRGGHMFLVQDRAAFPAIVEFLERSHA